MPVDTVNSLPIIFSCGCERLLATLANKDPAARKYAEWTGRACTKDGIDYVLKEVEACDLEGALKEANEDSGRKVRSS